MFQIPVKVRCIRAVNPAAQAKYPGVDFGVPGLEYEVQAIVPNGMYYVLGKRSPEVGPLGDPGEVNHILNMDRFEVIKTIGPEGWK